MPALSTSGDASAFRLDSLVPRDPEDSSLLARQPATDYVNLINTLGQTARLDKRQSQQGQQQITPGIIPTYYDVSGPTPGTVVGIVLGSVAGFLLIVWLLYSLANLNNSGGNRGGATIAGEEEIVVRKRARRGSQSGRSRRSTRTEVREYSRSPRRREQVIVEERRAPPQRVRSIIVEDRSRVPGDDVVEVIEEHDEYRTRRGSRRSGGYR